MIIEAAQQLASSGFTLEQEVRDDHGIVGVTMLRNNELYCLVAKQYAYKDRASFIKKVAAFAASKDVVLVFYSEDDDEYTFFDAETVAVFGDDSVGDSKKGAAEWREIPLSYGIDLEAHLDGAWPTLPGNQAQLGAY